MSIIVYRLEWAERDAARLGATSDPPDDAIGREFASLGEARRALAKALRGHKPVDVYYRFVGLGGRGGGGVATVQPDRPRGRAGNRP